MRRVWYPRGAQILHEGRILHLNSVLDALHGISGALRVKGANGAAAGAEFQHRRQELPRRAGVATLRGRWGWG